MLYGTIVWANYFFNLPIINMSKRNLTFLFASSTVLFLGAWYFWKHQKKHFFKVIQQHPNSPLYKATYNTTIQENHTINLLPCGYKKALDNECQKL
jgi:ABC-type nickel/cobalt efflux system permease component RcnA